MLSAIISNYYPKTSISVFNPSIISYLAALSFLNTAVSSFLYVIASFLAYLTKSITSSTLDPLYKDKETVTNKLAANWDLSPAV